MQQKSAQYNPVIPVRKFVWQQWTVLKETRREVTAGREIQSEAHFRNRVRLQLLFPFCTVQEICESQYIAVFDVMLGTALI